MTRKVKPPKDNVKQPIASAFLNVPNKQFADQHFDDLPGVIRTPEASLPKQYPTHPFDGAKGVAAQDTPLVTPVSPVTRDEALSSARNTVPLDEEEAFADGIMAMENDSEFDRDRNVYRDKVARFLQSEGWTRNNVNRMLDDRLKVESFSRGMNQTSDPESMFLNMPDEAFDSKYKKYGKWK